MPVVLFLLAWCASLAFAAWALWMANHHVWAVLVPILGVASIQIDNAMRS